MTEQYVNLYSWKSWLFCYRSFFTYSDKNLKMAGKLAIGPCQVHISLTAKSWWKTIFSSSSGLNLTRIVRLLFVRIHLIVSRQENGTDNIWRFAYSARKSIHRELQEFGFSVDLVWEFSLLLEKAFKSTFMHWSFSSLKNSSPKMINTESLQR